MAQPIDISGYNKVFRSFVTFAEGALHTEKGAKSIANVQLNRGLLAHRFPSNSSGRPRST